MTDTTADFWMEAACQLACAGCDKLPKSWDWDAHHVVEKQTLRARGLPLWGRRNALKLCNLCHARQTSAYKRVLLTKLRDDNIVFAFEVLGAYAYDYLKRKYDGEDERLEAALRKAEHG